MTEHSEAKAQISPGELLYNELYPQLRQYQDLVMPDKDFVDTASNIILHEMVIQTIARNSGASTLDNVHKMFADLTEYEEREWWFRILERGQEVTGMDKFNEEMKMRVKTHIQKSLTS